MDGCAQSKWLKAAVPIERTLALALSVIPRLVLITLVPGAYARG
jgi:hypothetical protein